VGGHSVNAGWDDMRELYANTMDKLTRPAYFYGDAYRDAYR